MIALTIPFIALFIASIYLFCVEYTCHIKFTKEHSKFFGSGTFGQFLEEMEKRRWDRLHERLFVSNDGSHLSEWVIKFGKEGMLLGPMDYIRYRLFIRRQMQKKSKAYYWRE